MKKYKLSILVPHSSEDPDRCRFLFDSIGKQKGVDLSEIEVLVCDDGPGCPNIDDALCGRKYLIRHFESPKLGVSGIRNRLLDEAEGEYIMYCDADDGFFRDDGLARIFKAFSEKSDAVPEIGVPERKAV